MAKQDFFHEIAKTKHPADSTDREIPPREIPDQELSRTEDIFLKPMERPGYEEQKAKFTKDLEKLREQYRPFMADYRKDWTSTVERTELRKFFFRYVGKDECFTERNDLDQEWEKVTIPDYRGPAGKDGKWDGYYRNYFSCPPAWKERVKAGERIVIDFQCVDYIAQVFVNGNFAGSHEGLFAPFSFDITKYIREENELVILCKNDVPILGEGEFLDGDKIYAATGPGWDEPNVGWHHCPAGAGVFGKVGLELRPSIFVDDIFVRPDLEHGMAEVRVGVINYRDEVVNDLSFILALSPKNYRGEEIGGGSFPVKAVGPGKNEYRYFLSIKDYRIWEPDTPWLYSAEAELQKGRKSISRRRQTFGLKTFVSDETTNPRGKFFLNGKPVMLRGANEMGHLQQCVMKGDFDQLVDDILIAKLCNLNYYRVTQRPVQEEIYDYFDMLGMMHQCDFPLFSFLRRPQFAEAVRQVTEMEHLVRRHVSTVMVTFINEPMCIRRTEDPTDKFSRRYDAKGHRHLLRDELEAFFSAARKAVYTENPDRVIKNVEGDYDGPTLEGMPDFHTYTMWYTNHGQPIGKLMRGYLPPVKSGWMMGCGEYGAEGLDPEEILLNRCPKEWTALTADEKWYPDKIVRAQTHSVQGDWYKEQDNLTDWVRESQIHQANATRLMTDAFRRRGDLIQQTAIHLLIDAWPTGWMKTLVDCERTPKRAYFAYQEALIPLKVNLYTGRTSGYEGEVIPVEFWVLNDTSRGEELVVHAEIFKTGQEKACEAFEEAFHIDPADARCAGIIPVTLRQRGLDRSVTVHAAILNEKREVLHEEELTIEVFARKKVESTVYALGREAEMLAELYGASRMTRADGVPESRGETSECAGNGALKGMGVKDGGIRSREMSDHAESPAKNPVMLVSGCSREDIERMEQYVKDGGNALWLLPEEKCETEFDGVSVRTKPCGDLFFAAADGVWEKYPISMVYNHDKGYIDGTAAFTVDTDLPGETLVYTYGKQGFQGSEGAKPHLPFVKRCQAGKGALTLCTLARKGRVGYNGGLDRMLQALMRNE